MAESSFDAYKDKFNRKRGDLKAKDGQKSALMQIHGQYNEKHGQLKAYKGRKEL